MANQKWPAHVPKPKDDADRRCTGPLFQNWRLPIDRFERTRNNVVVFATGRDVCRSQRSLRSPGLVWSCVALLTIGCIAILVTSLRLDSEVFNVLPGRFSSVQGLKIYDRDFEQTRELTFALLCDPNDVDKLEEFAPMFAERLRQQPWCARVLAGSPMGTPEGSRDLQLIAVPLLLNLKPNAF